MILARVTRTPYFLYKQDEEGRYQAPVVGVYVWGGSSLHRTESLTYEVESDYCISLARRRSDDNGETWSDFEVIALENPRQGGFELEQSWFAVCHDPLRNHDVRFDFQRLFVGTGSEALNSQWQGEERIFDHGFYCLSKDLGRTFTSPRLLRYEDGDDFEESDWGRPRYLKRNNMYGGYTAIVTRAGKLVYPFCCRTTVSTAGGEQTTCGVRCMIGTWDEAAGDYVWEVSSPVAVPLECSGRGLMEPTIAELVDGRLAMSLRGSTDVERLFCPQGGVQVTQPGRHWLTVSEDGGYTWGPVRAWCYADGEPFYSPSAFSRLLRHSSGKLFWIGNICPEPPQGNMPRHPLVIAEVDEAGPALVKDTVTVIDTKGEHEAVHEYFQLSNFTAFENAQTGAIELYLTRYGEAPEHWLKANAYKYVIELM